MKLEVHVMITLSTSPEPKTLKSPRLKVELQRLRQTDNYRNFYYLLRTYALIAAVIGGAIWFYHFQRSAGLSFWWNVPVTLLAITAIGALQHQLAGLAHEGAHHTLFRNRYLNELASDWLCMFPLLTTTHHYRLQHLAHHQFVNDPERDPDLSQLQSSGHWLKFPLSKAQFCRALARQLWPPRLMRFMRVRARYNAVPTAHSPYLRKGWKPARLPVVVGAGYLVGLIGLLAMLVRQGDPTALAVWPAVAWLGMAIFYLVLPGRLYHQTRIHSTISPRWMSVGRLTHTSAVFACLAWITLATGEWAAFYYVLLWTVPAFTSLSFFMILRQLVQHGNAGRGWLTNTRVFFLKPVVRFSVFPIGQDYHLPHHLFATVPHYRLPELHEILLECADYRAQAVVVEGYFQPPRPGAERPTVIEVLGPAYAPRVGSDVYIDNTVLEGVRVDEKTDILREARLSQTETGAASTDFTDSADEGPVTSVRPTLNRFGSVAAGGS
jgi:fatty acid desaturase